jgi:hypothetical protein
MEERNYIPIDEFSGLFRAKNGETRDAAIEAFAIDCAREFQPNADYNQFWEHHPTTMRGLNHGYLSLITNSNGNSHVYMPFPVLHQNLAPIDIDVLGPCGCALKHVCDSCSAFNMETDTEQKGKLFEYVLLYSLLLFARSNQKFNLSSLCKRHGEKLNMSLLGGSHVDLWEDIEDVLLWVNLTSQSRSTQKISSD